MTSLSIVTQYLQSASKWSVIELKWTENTSVPLQCQMYWVQFDEYIVSMSKERSYLFIY